MKPQKKNLNMEIKKLDSIHVFPLLLLSFVSFILLHSQPARAQNTTIPVNVGVVLDMDRWIGQMGLSCISMALSDFYASHGFYKTRVALNNRDSKEDVVGAAAAALDLLKNVQVQAIIGPVSSMQAGFIIDLGEKAHVPIISFSATSPSLTSNRSPYFIRATQNDSSQVMVISSIVKAFGWREVVPIYVDNDFGEGIVPFLTDALGEVNLRVPYRSGIPPSATDDQIVAELYKLMTMQTRIFVVHMLPDLGSRLFTKAKELGMLSEGYAWIITDAMTNELNSVDSSAIDSMQGVIGIKPYVPQTKELESFTSRWKLKFQQNNPSIHNPELNVFGLWAYDSATALAMAVEKEGAASNLGFQKPNVSRNSTDLETISVSNNGPMLLQEILNTTFKGLSGDFGIVDGQLKPPAYQIVNVIGTGARPVGFWTAEDGFVSQLNVKIKNTYSTAKTTLGTIIWPGFSTTPPKGWMFPTNGKRLKVLVPVKDGFSEFVRVTRDTSTNTTAVTGYCIDVFDAVVASVPYAVQYDYIPFSTSGGQSAGSYDDLVYQVHLGNYDAGVGDITTVANRSQYVDFSLPFTESGVSMVVPIQDNKNKNAWVFVKPLTWDLWLTSFLFFVLIGVLIWILEHRINEEFRGPRSHQVGTLVWFAFSTMVFAHREKIVSNLARFVLIIWFLVVLILTQAYTASLTSMLTVQQLQPTITNVDELIRNKEYVGYQKGSFVFGFLKQRGFDESRLLVYNSVEELDQLFNNGSKGGGIAAAFDEIPYIQLFLSRYCSKYTTVKPTYKTDGFGFVFPIGSPLVTDISRAVLSVAEGDSMVKIEKAWFPKSSSCSDSSTSLTSNSLGMGSFWGLFLIVGVAAGLAFIIYLVLFLHEHQNIATNSQLSLGQKIKQLAHCFDNKDLSCHTFRNIELRVETHKHRDGSERMTIVSPCSNPPGGPFSLSLQVPPTPSSSSPIQDQGTPSREDIILDRSDTSPSPSPSSQTREQMVPFSRKNSSLDQPSTFEIITPDTEAPGVNQERQGA